MEKEITGIHHVTAICGEPQENIDFYAGVLGLRLVKLTVNFDDPSSYHLYYGDGVGSPSTLLTFFPMPGAQRGRRGYGQATSVSFSVPQGSLLYWRDRLSGEGVRYEESQRFSEHVLSFEDPDGLLLELVEGSYGDVRQGWVAGPVPQEYAIRGFYNVTLLEADLAATQTLISDVLKFRAAESEDTRQRYTIGDGGPAAFVDVIQSSGEKPGIVAVGTVHHVAWRVADAAGQVAWHNKLEELGYNVTPVVDRQYFTSIYFREPGGVLFEIATDGPGFAIDETVETLGTSLKLPPKYEHLRPYLEHTLPPLNLPQASRA